MLPTEQTSEALKASLGIIKHLVRASLAVAALARCRARVLDHQANLALLDGVSLVVLAVAKPASRPYVDTQQEILMRGHC